MQPAFGAPSVRGTHHPLPVGQPGRYAHSPRLDTGRYALVVCGSWRRSRFRSVRRTPTTSIANARSFVQRALCQQEMVASLQRNVFQAINGFFRVEAGNQSGKDRAACALFLPRCGGRRNRAVRRARILRGHTQATDGAPLLRPLPTCYHAFAQLSIEGGARPRASLPRPGQASYVSIWARCRRPE